MTKKRTILAFMIITLLLAGCVAQNTNNNSNKIETNNQHLTMSIEENSENEFETIGYIFSIRDDQVCIFANNMTIICPVNPDELENFYLGQKVSVAEKTDDQYTLTPVLDDEITLEQTHMGHSTRQIVGEVLYSNDEEILIATPDDNLTLSKGNGLITEVGENYEFGLIELNGKEYVFAAYNEKEKQTFTITKIMRQEYGEMEIWALDESDVEYLIWTYRGYNAFNYEDFIFSDEYTLCLYQAKVNFNYTDLKVGQKLEVYVSKTNSSRPPQIETPRIDLIKDQP